MMNKLLRPTLIVLFFMSIITGLLISSGCTKQNLDQLDLERSIEQVNAFFPHPKDWKGRHMSFVVSRSNSDKNSNNGSFAMACDQCHIKTGNLQGKSRNVGCATACHTRSTNGEPTHFPKPKDHKCVKCHNNIVQNKFDHYPSAVGLCETCHTADADHLEDRNGVVTTNKKASHCYQCHARMDEGPVLHKALKSDESCISCHNPHGSQNRYFLEKETMAILCNTCHTPATGIGSRHAPAVQGKACINCHNPHSSQNKKLLVKPSRELCLSCHDRIIRGSLNGVRTIPNIKAKVEASSKHTGAKGNCTDCHDAHASDYKRLLIDEYSSNIYNAYSAENNPYAICFSCHSDSMLNETGYESSTDFRDTAKGVNDHWFHVVDAAGNTDKNRGRSCKICHDPHGSEQPFNINTSWKMGERDIRIEYTPMANGGQCTKTCHNARTYQR